MKITKHILFSVGLIILFSISSCTQEGSTVTEPSLLDIEGNEVDFTGKITVLNVWATWCGTCVGEIAALNQILAARWNRTIVHGKIFIVRDRTAIFAQMKAIREEKQL